MTKAGIVREIAKTTGIGKAADVVVIERFMTVVRNRVAHGENVCLRGFCSFMVKTCAEKTARNISKGTTIFIPAHNIQVFRQAGLFKAKTGVSAQKFNFTN